ncbi:MAG: NAD-dependent epimerase/dehydratase family protein [Pseudomonadota bacterium]|nr:NAD-dependent epimerase/dehydratase family protein [Pseudomonadota bacterium]
MSAAGAAAGPRILVTGGTGLVGQAVVAMLLRDFPDCRPRVPYRGDLGAFHDDPRVEYVRADLTERDSCRGLVADCVGAVLCAATTGGAAGAAPTPSPPPGRRAE